MSFFPIQNSFEGGEISPRLYGRTDTPWYKKGVQFSENFMHLAQGLLRYRPGTKYLVDAYQQGTGVRLIPFNTIQGVDYCAELGPGYIRLLNKDGLVPVVPITSGGEIIKNNLFQQGSANWSPAVGILYSQYAWTGQSGFVDMIGGEQPEPDPEIHYFPHPLNGLPSFFQAVAPGAGSYSLIYGCGVPNISGHTNRGIRVTIGTVVGGATIYDRHVAPGTNVVDTVAIPSGTVYIKFWMDGSVAPLVASRVVSPSLKIISGGSAVLTGCPWTEEMLPELQYVQDINEGLLLVHRKMKPQKIKLDPNSGSFSRIDITFTNPPADWTGSNYPGAIEIFQSRLYFASSPDKPTTIWASRVFNYYDFSVDATIVASSPFTLGLGTKGAIQWLRGKQSLVIGTELHEDIIISATQVISALDAQLLRQSAYGSAYLQAIDIGDQILYISRDISKLRALNFEFQTQAWLAHDVTFYAQHITKEGILSTAFARDPENTIYTLLTNGQIRMCTYDRLEQVQAWSRWKTNGNVLSICTTNDPTSTTIWLAVNRFGTTCIETIPSFDAETPYFLDCRNTSTPTVYLSGTEQRIRIPVTSTALVGQLVGVVVDGAYLGDASVGGVAPNAVDLPFNGPSAGIGTVGLRYRGQCLTLPLEGGVMYGTSQGQMKSRIRIDVRLASAALPLLNGKRPSPERTPATPMNVVEPAKIFDYFVTNLGWDKYARVLIEQDIPLQTDICAIFGKAETTQL